MGHFRYLYLETYAENKAVFSLNSVESIFYNSRNSPIDKYFRNNNFAKIISQRYYVFRENAFQATALNVFKIQDVIYIM